MSVESKLWFFSSYVWMWELDLKENWAPKNWCFWTVVLEKSLESPLDFKEIQPVNPKENQSWIFIGRTEAPIFWPPDANSQLIRKEHEARKAWRQEENGIIVDEMAIWYHWLDGCEFEQAARDDEGQGSLACCSLRGHKESTWLSEWTTTIQ